MCGFNATTVVTDIPSPDASIYTIIAQAGVYRGWNTSGSLLHAGDLQGRSVRVGAPLVLRESSHSQPFVILGAPPMHVDYVQLAGSSSVPAVVNFSALPTDFAAQFDTASQDTSQSTSTQTTSYTQARMNSDSLGVKLDIPYAGSVLGTISQSTAETHDNYVSTSYDTYTGSNFDISTRTRGDDYLWFDAAAFNAYYYPVVGQTVCNGDSTDCDSSDQVPLLITFSGPEEAGTEAIDGSVVEWYQPIEEPFQVLSYPWSEDQLLARVPQATVLSDTLKFFTDSTEVTETVQWSNNQGTDESTGATVTHSKDSSRSLTTGSPDLTQEEGSNSSYTISMSYSDSSSLSTLNTDVTLAGDSSGVAVVKPGNFADPRLYAYRVAPYILGEGATSGTVQTIETDTTVSTTGALQVAYVADPTDANAGSWWEGGAYTKYIDVALNHPARWAVSAGGGQDTTTQGAECLLNLDGYTVSCARLNDPDPSDLWNSEFYWMRGLLVTVGSTGGPQRTQATAGETLFLTARVYNYSLKAMPDDSTVHVRFYRQPWDTSTQSAVGDSVLIAENVLDPIPPFNSSTDPTSPNWVLTSASFDTTDLGDTSMIFWVIVWAEDSSGNLLSELPGHGLSAKPGTLTSIADAPLEQVTYEYEKQQVTSSFSNNVAFFHLAFFVAPKTQNASVAEAATVQGDAAGRALAPPPLPTQAPRTKGALLLERLSDKPILAKLAHKVAVGVTLRSPDADREGILVMFYDGDPDAGGRAFDAEMVGHVGRSAPFQVRVPYRAQTCGDHTLTIVANHGKPDEVRTTVPFTADCATPAATPTAAPTVTSTPSKGGGSGGGCAIGAPAPGGLGGLLLLPIGLLLLWGPCRQRSPEPRPGKQQ